MFVWANEHGETRGAGLLEGPGIPQQRGVLDRIIYDELVRGQVLTASRREVVRMIDGLWDAGAGGVILGCTELELLVRQPDVELPVFPCTSLHVEAALDRALA